MGYVLFHTDLFTSSELLDVYLQLKQSTVCHCLSLRESEIACPGSSCLVGKLCIVDDDYHAVVELG